MAERQGGLAWLAVAPAPGFFGSRDFKTTDSFFVWQGDALSGTLGYTTYYLLDGTSVGKPLIVRWIQFDDPTGASLGNYPLLLGNRAVYLRCASGLPAYHYPAPWTP